jgi:oligopeptide transport system substrate-binding protein
MKRLNLRHSFALALLFALIVPILAACGGTTPAAAPTAAAPAADAPTAAAPAAEAPTTAPAEAATAVPAEAPTAMTEAPTAGAVSEAGNVLRVAESTWPEQLAPQKSSFTHEIAVEMMNYEGLTRYDKDLKTVPGAAESWEYNADGTEITFKLRDGLKYSDGSPLVAQDFVNAIYRLLDPHTPGDYQTSVDMIKGADAIISTEVPTDEAKLADLNKALGVTAVDEKTVKFTLTKPTPYFHTLAGMWVLYPAKQELIDKGGELWHQDAANQLGNGPFQITKIDQSNNLIEFKANENYWGGKPKLDGLQYRYIEDLAVALQAYKNNEVDIVVPDPNDVPTLKADPDLGKEYVEFPGACTLTIAMNLEKAPFDNKKVRQAFSTGYDREGYIRDALKDTAIKTLTWIPPGYPGYDASETRFDYNPDAAKALLAEAGFPNGEGLPEIKYTYSSSNPANQARAEYIVQMFKTSLGLDIALDPLESKALVAARKSRDTYPQMLGGGWCADFPDQWNWISIYWRSTSSFAQNIAYNNPEVDKLIDQADIELDVAKRAKLYDDAQKLIIDDQGEIFTRNTKNYFLIKPGVTGYDKTPQDSHFPGQTTGLMNVTITR